MNKIIQEVDLIDVIDQINKRGKVAQRVFLNNLELIVLDKDQFMQIRKLFLDFSNNQIRSDLEAIFGKDFEGFIR